LIAFHVETLPAVGSTNDVVRERALAGAPEGLVVRAEEQLAGRGRHGRVWSSPRGNLYVSILFRPSRPLNEAATLSLALGLGLADAIATAVGSGAAGPGLALRLKWPNDLLAGGAKIAGILLENVSVDPGQPAIVAGLGVNVAAAPGGLPYPATTLAALGLQVTPEALLQRLLAHLGQDYALWQAGGFAALRGRWLARAQGLGQPAGVRVGERTISGRFVDVDEAGHLVLEGEAGRLRLNAGELFFAPEAAARW
jgi:BirA family transcriptional regulator, biotin operon repressor / biotin---[acetyl-CoA-carboxylase] ligase